MVDRRKTQREIDRGNEDFFCGEGSGARGERLKEKEKKEKREKQVWQ